MTLHKHRLLSDLTSALFAFSDSACIPTLENLNKFPPPLSPDRETQSNHSLTKKCERLLGKSYTQHRNKLDSQSVFHTDKTLYIRQQETKQKQNPQHTTVQHYDMDASLLSGILLLLLLPLQKDARRTYPCWPSAGGHYTLLKGCGCHLLVLQAAGADLRAWEERLRLGLWRLQLQGRSGATTTSGSPELWLPSC